jgi:hypothetical protein
MHGEGAVLIDRDFQFSYLSSGGEIEEEGKRWLDKKVKLQH